MALVLTTDFKPYIEDILREAGPWLDQIFLGVWDPDECPLLKVKPTFS